MPARLPACTQNVILPMKKSYVFFADGFEEVEALTIVDILRRAGMPVETVSIHDRNTVTGAHGVPVVADALLADVAGGEAEWLVCPGGMPGATNLASCEPLCRWLKSHYDAGEKVAAICASPAIVLAPLGMLDGRKAVCYPGMENHDCDAEWCDAEVAVIDNVTTGNGPAAAAEFAFALVEQSLDRDQSMAVAEGMLFL